MAPFNKGYPIEQINRPLGERGFIKAMVREESYRSPLLYPFENPH